MSVVTPSVELELRSARKRRMTALIVTVSVAALVFLAVYVLRPELQLGGERLPESFPTEGFDHSSFESLLGRFVTQDGKVNYEMWHQDGAAREKLRRYLSAVGRFSPESDPDRFPTDADKTAYWLSAYNAQVIGAILERWPLQSVTDVKAPIEFVRGLGFFYKLRFKFGGVFLSLYDVEHHHILDKAQDPRVHFVLNCGSGSCPILRPKLPTGDALGPYLEEAAADFVKSADNVSVDHEKREVVLSKIFEWYESDFLDDLRRRGLPTEGGLLEYIRLVSDAETQARLQNTGDYRVRFREYDWAVNHGDTQ